MSSVRRKKGPIKDSLTTDRETKTLKNSIQQKQRGYKAASQKFSALIDANVSEAAIAAADAARLLAAKVPGYRRIQIDLAKLHRKLSTAEMDALRLHLFATEDVVAIAATPTKYELVFDTHDKAKAFMQGNMGGIRFKQILIHFMPNRANTTHTITVLNPTLHNTDDVIIPLITITSCISALGTITDTRTDTHRTEDNDIKAPPNSNLTFMMSSPPIKSLYPRSLFIPKLNTTINIRVNIWDNPLCPHCGDVPPTNRACPCERAHISAIPHQDEIKLPDPPKATPTDPIPTTDSIPTADPIITADSPNVPNESFITPNPIKSMPMRSSQDKDLILTSTNPFTALADEGLELDEDDITMLDAIEAACTTNDPPTIDPPTIDPTDIIQMDSDLYRSTHPEPTTDIIKWRESIDNIFIIKWKQSIAISLAHPTFTQYFMPPSPGMRSSPLNSLNHLTADQTVFIQGMIIMDNIDGTYRGGYGAISTHHVEGDPPPLPSFPLQSEEPNSPSDSSLHPKGNPGKRARKLRRRQRVMLKEKMARLTNLEVSEYDNKYSNNILNINIQSQDSQSAVTDERWTCNSNLLGWSYAHLKGGWTFIPSPTLIKQSRRPIPGLLDFLQTDPANNTNNTGINNTINNSIKDHPRDACDNWENRASNDSVIHTLDATNNGPSEPADHITDPTCTPILTLHPPNLTKQPDQSLEEPAMASLGGLDTTQPPPTKPPTSGAPCDSSVQVTGQYDPSVQHPGGRCESFLPRTQKKYFFPNSRPS